MLDHHLVEPGFHARAALAALAIPAVVPLDASRDPMEADLLALPVLAFGLRLGRCDDRDLLRLDAVQDRAVHRLRQILPRRIEREAQHLREAVHDPAVPRLRIVPERLADEATARNAALWIGNEQLRMRQLVDTETAARSAGALGVVEHEELGRDVT